MAYLKTEEQMAAKLLKEGMSQRLRRLRLVVDLLERDVQQNFKMAEEGRTHYGTVTENFYRDLIQGVVNLGLEAAMSTAASADSAHARGE